MTRQERCIVCESRLRESGGNGDLRQYDCPRCGTFAISLSACAMLGGRLDDPRARARFSHAIRRRSDEQPWVGIDSSNLDRMIAERLPDFAGQRAKLLSWLAARLGESGGEAVVADEAAMPAVIGTVSGAVVDQHVDDLVTEGLMRELRDKAAAQGPRQWSLTGAGWREAAGLEPTMEAEIAEYDLFVSHASEDKALFVDDLVTELQALGLRIWYDAAVLRIGDSLRRSIDQGLVRSRFGVVVLSPAFFAKEWPQRELDGLVALEIAGEPRILPLWHGLSQAQVAQYSPTLADKLALSTSLGAAPIAAELAARVAAPG
jgi:hypothetical protein